MESLSSRGTSDRGTSRDDSGDYRERKVADHIVTTQLLTVSVGMQDRQAAPFQNKWRRASAILLTHWEGTAYLQWLRVRVSGLRD